MKASTNLSSLPTEIHTQILEYLDNFIDQINAGCALPLWNGILHHSSLYHYSPHLRRSRYVRFQSAWQNAVAIHCAIGGLSNDLQLTVCCAVRNGEIERASLAWKPLYPFINLQRGGILQSIGDMDQSWTEIDLKNHFILNDHFMLPFRGTIARGLELPGEDVSISKSHIDSDLRTSFVKVKFKSPSSHDSNIFVKVDEISVFPSHPEDMTFRSFMQFIVREADRVFKGRHDDTGIKKLHYFKICADDDLSVTLYMPSQELGGF
ncbi:hypothetical protein TWF730_002973 [Orbilia blumenaviensis]|uniref:F-box domain-containing protein n=1 Tax=Orbilia blumenaviensis TaxID=1796055 RepID=A0AAV9UC01_9PEZI